MRCGYLSGRKAVLVAANFARRAVANLQRYRRADAPALKRTADRAASLVNALERIEAEMLEIGREWRAAAGLPPDDVEGAGEMHLLTFRHMLSEGDDRYSLKRDLIEHDAARREVEEFIESFRRTRDGARAMRNRAERMRARLAPPNKAGDTWKIAFVTSLGGQWSDLTGRDPSPDSGHYVRFCQAAAATLGAGDEDAYPLREQIRTAWETNNAVDKGTGERARAPHDRFDAGRTGALPPGTTAMPIAEWRAREVERKVRFEAAVVRALTANDPEERRLAEIALLGDWSFILDAEENRAEVERIRREHVPPARPH